VWIRLMKHSLNQELLAVTENCAIRGKKSGKQ
jgi:hypothetical protein